MKFSTNTWIFVAAGLTLGLVAIAGAGDFRLPGNHQGYRPEQPIAYSHRQHAGELAIKCQYCHYGASKSRSAGIPSVSICMNCHRHVTAGFDAVLEERQRAEEEGREPARVISPALAELYDALALDSEMNPIPGREPRPPQWVRVHNLPDFVNFDHRPHVSRGLACQTCHGPVQGMERLQQEGSLSMGWCLDCHRTSPAEPGAVPPMDGDFRRSGVHVTTDCTNCHL